VLVVPGGAHDQSSLDQQVQPFRGLLGPGVAEGLEFADLQDTDPPSSCSPNFSSKSRTK
jgi:hypothetical protein